MTAIASQLARRPAQLALAALARFAWRDLRGGLAGLRIFLVCIALGVAAIVAVNSLARSLDDGLARDGRTIVGGDASFSLIHRELAPEERAFLSSRGELSTIATLRAMARSEAGDATLVEVKAVERFLATAGRGRIRPRDGDRARRWRSDGELYGAAVEQALLDRLGLKIGDVFTIGAAHFEIRTALLAEPDRLATGIGFGPRVLIAQDALRASGLIQPGALIRWTTRVILDPGGRAAKRRRRQCAGRRCGSGVSRGWLGGAHARQRLARLLPRPRSLRRISRPGRPDFAGRRRRRRRQCGAGLRRA